MKGELEKTLLLFERSDFIFISYGSEIEGKYIPHSQALRIYPELSLLEKAIEKTPQPNDFGIMPFEWRANSEEDKTHILLERKLSRWTEGELFAHGYLVIRRLLLDIDIGEKYDIKLRTKELLEKLKEIGIGKVGYTGGGLLAVIELDDEIVIKDRQAFREIIRTVSESIKKLIPDVDEQSFNAGKGVRLIGTFSRKRNVQTHWLLWEEGKRFDLCELVFGVSRDILSRAPEELRRKIEEKFSLRISGAVRKSSPEEVFIKASEFYGDLDGRRNDFMLKLSGEMYSEGVDRERVIELYYEHLAHLEKKDSPRTRVKQTIDWVYKEGKKYRFSEGDVPHDFYTAVLGFRGKESPLSWREFAQFAGPQNFIGLLKKLGVKLYESESGVFIPEASLLSADIRCMWTEEDENSGSVIREGVLRIPVFMDLPHCIRSALKDYENIANGETEFFLENLIAVSFLLPESSFRPVDSRKDLKLIDNPLAKALLIMTSAKNIDESEISVERIKRKVNKKNDSVWNLVRCANPLLKERCTEECEYYRFRHTLPEVIRRKVDKKTGEVKSALIRVEGEELKVEGWVLSSFKRFSNYLEKRGYLFPKISVEWLYQGITKFSEREFVDTQAEEFRDQLSEILAELGEYYIDKFDGKNIWVSGKKFMELMGLIGMSMDKKNIKRIREEFGFKVKRTRDSNFTLVPLDFIHEEDKDAVVFKTLRSIEDFLITENIEAEIKEEVTENDMQDEDYILGRKAYIAHTEDGILVSYCGDEKIFKEPAELKGWIKECKNIEQRGDDEILNL